MGSQIQIEAELDEGVPLRLLVEVLRCTRMESTSPGKEAWDYQVGCRFLQIPRLDQIHLRRYVNYHMPSVFSD